MTRRHLSLSFLTIALSLAACSSTGVGPGEDAPDGGAAGGGAPDGGADPEDPGPPEVVSVTPANDALGVMPDADIVIVFDRPMDQGSVEEAWSSQDLPAGEVTFSWNQAGDTLTATPDAPLPIAEADADDPDAVPPISFAVEIGAAAADLAGVRLAYPVEIEFATARRFEVALAAVARLTDTRASTGQSMLRPAGTEFAGDSSSNLQVKILLTFALPELPASAVLEQASLAGEQTSDGGTAYKSLGPLAAVRVQFDDLSTAFGAESLGELGSFSTIPLPGKRSLVVTEAVSAELAAGRERAQFRLEFPTATDADDSYDTANFSQAAFVLRMTYLAE